MKRIITIVFLLFSIIYGLKANSKDSLIIIELKEQNKLLTSENNQLKIIVESQKNISEGFSFHSSWLEILVGVLGGIVGLISFALPLMIYFFQIRPAEKIINEVKDIDNKVELKLNEYLNNIETSRIDNAIQELNSQDERIINNALNLLSFNLTYYFNDSQLLKIYEILTKSNNKLNNKKAILLYILGSREFLLADEYFTSAIKKVKDFSVDLDFYHAIKYFSIVGFEKHVQKFIDYIFRDNANSVKIGSRYSEIAFYVLVSSTDSFKILVNNSNLNSRLDIATRRQVYNRIKADSTGYNAEIILNESLLAKDLFE